MVAAEDGDVPGQSPASAAVGSVKAQLLNAARLAPAVIPSRTNHLRPQKHDQHNQLIDNPSTVSPSPSPTPPPRSETEKSVVDNEENDDDADMDTAIADASIAAVATAAARDAVCLKAVHRVFSAIPCPASGATTPCVACDNADIMTGLIKCSDCGQHTHGHCLNPPLTHQPTCSWRCAICLSTRLTSASSQSVSTQTDDRVSVYLADENRDWLPLPMRYKPHLAAHLPAKPNHRSLPLPPTAPAYGKPVTLSSGTVVPIRYAVTGEDWSWSDPEEDEVVHDEGYARADEVDIPPGMQACEYCKMPHSGSFGSGRFCSSKCARTVGGLSRRRNYAAAMAAAGANIAVGGSPGEGVPLFGPGSRGGRGGRGSRGSRGSGRGSRGGGRGRGRGRAIGISVGNSVVSALANAVAASTAAMAASSTATADVSPGHDGNAENEDIPSTGATAARTNLLCKRKHDGLAVESLASCGAFVPKSVRDSTSVSAGAPAKPGKGYKFCHECGELVANRRFVCVHCGTRNPSSKVIKRPRIDIVTTPVISTALTAGALGAATAATVVAAAAARGGNTGSTASRPALTDAVDPPTIATTNPFISFTSAALHIAPAGSSLVAPSVAESYDEDDDQSNRATRGDGQSSLSMRDRRDALLKHATRTSSDSGEDTPSESESEDGEGATMGAEDV
jgi:uncharacterized membrane protein YgcG